MEIVVLRSEHDRLYHHRKFKDLAVFYKKLQNTNILDKQGNVLFGIQCKINRWKEHVKDLFEDE